jgi:hypothetical protein
MKVTLDTNCIINLEENRPACGPIRELVDMHSAGSLRLAVVGISASENLPGGGSARTFAAFREKTARLGLAQAEVLKPMGIWGVTYWDWGLLADGPMVQLARRIHAVLFPLSPYDYIEYCKSRGIAVDEDSIHPQWRNQLCDVLAIRTHIYYRRDVFVTRDDNFMKPRKRKVLEAMGANKIYTRAEALALVKHNLTS